jgi:hypothetical protein
VFGAFSFYLGLVTVTDFNSFRQNVPFMAAFGLVAVIEGIRHDEPSRESVSVTRVET